MFQSSFWGRGFRPFFFFGALWAVCLFLLGYLVFEEYLPLLMGDIVFWHAHEMVFGFVMAIVAAFLLTAVANWTKLPPVKGGGLASLCVLWGVGRLALFLKDLLPLWAILLAECLFPLVLLITLSIPLIKTKNKRNFLFLGLLCILCVLDIFALVNDSLFPIYLAVFVVIIMISVISSRIIPAFTRSGLMARGVVVEVTQHSFLALLSISSLFLLFLGVLLFKDGMIVSIIAWSSALLHLARVYYYHPLLMLRIPLLAVLLLGYLWLCYGLCLFALYAAGYLPFSLALHALTVGCIGTMTLGMMCRVSLGHTGRMLTVSVMTVLAFILMQVSAVSRSIMPIFLPNYWVYFIFFSAMAWCSSYLIFLLTYSRILFTKRPDGKPV